MAYLNIKLTLSCTLENTLVTLKMSRISSQQPLVNADLITEYKFHLEDAIDRLMKESKFESTLFYVGIWLKWRKSCHLVKQFNNSRQFFGVDRV